MLDSARNMRTAPAADRTARLCIVLMAVLFSFAQWSLATRALGTSSASSIAAAQQVASEMLCRLGAREEDLFLGTINAGHPGGSLPLTEREAGSLHHARLPDNLYVADASLLPRSLGNPPILTIVALAKRVSKLCREQVH